jgi:hypothetical protein
MANDKELLAPLKKAYGEHQEELKTSGLPFEQASIISLAADGMMFWELMGLNLFTVRQREKVKEALLKMVDDLEEKAK